MRHVPFDMVAAFGIEWHPVARHGGEFSGMRARRDDHMAGLEPQAGACDLQPIPLSFKAFHPCLQPFGAGGDFGGKKAHHPTRIVQEDGLGKIGRAPFDLGQGGLHLAQGGGVDQIDRNPQRPPEIHVAPGREEPLRRLVNIEAATLFQDFPTAQSGPQIKPVGAGIGHQAGDVAGVPFGGGGQGLQRETQEPGHQRGQRGAADGEGGVAVEEQRGQVAQHIGRADGKHGVIGDCPGISIACRVLADRDARRVGVDQHDLAAFGRQPFGNGEANHAAPDDGDIGGDMAEHRGRFPGR